jgi:hypothetical protein
MLAYLHILIRVDDDGSLHAIGAFTSKEKQLAYQKEYGLADNQVRLDFHNGPFDESIEVIYAGHRRWSTDRYQLAGYFKNEPEAWAAVTQEGYVNVLRIDSTYAEEAALQNEALDLCKTLQRRWRLASFQEMVKDEGADKALANIKLRFYEDSLESFKPKTQSGLRTIYYGIALILCLPVVALLYIGRGPDYGEDLASVDWLPSFASDVAYYRSERVHAYEFKVDEINFRQWAENRGMRVRSISEAEIIRRYKAYTPPAPSDYAQANNMSENQKEKRLNDWNNIINARIENGLIAEGDDRSTAVYDRITGIAYFEHLSL